VRVEDHLLDRVVLVGRLDEVWEPLHGEGGPLEHVGDDEVVEEGRVLLPDLVLLVDEPLFHLRAELLVRCRQPSVGWGRRDAATRWLSREGRNNFGLMEPSDGTRTWVQKAKFANSFGSAREMPGAMYLRRR
jgi:hypothetical protein